ncbi:MAG: hypothetical protein OYL97_21285 [Candidatus Poribacteria bacterium]|nr:hypothetical protein [Candidatus Poribacteria bacterium]
MNDSNPLHWSFDYNYGAQNPQFAQELIKTLRGYDPEIGTRGTQKAQTVTHVYDILPNYWRGYSRGGTKEELSIGTAIVERSKNDNNHWSYFVQYENTTSGENLEIKFSCSDEDYRPLTGNWSVDARNSGDDTYSRLLCEGYLALDSEIRLRINDAEIRTGTVDTSVKLTCNWALFDVIPALAQTIQASGDGIDIAVLEDLEQLRPKSRVGFLESIQTPLPLDGYYLYGTGLLPSYWWLDAHGNIAIASTFFETLVLREKMEDR